MRTFLLTLLTCAVVSMLAPGTGFASESATGSGTRSKSPPAGQIAGQVKRTEVPQDLRDWGFLVGRWDVVTTRYSFAGQAIEENLGRAEFSWTLDGLRLRELQSTTLSGQPMEVLRLFVVHPETRQWQVAYTDSLHNTFDVQAGSTVDGAVVLGERDPVPGGEVVRRWRYDKLSVDHVSLELEFSVDQGESFFLRSRTLYTRQRAD